VSRIYIGLCAILLLGAGAALAWYTTNSDDGADAPAPAVAQDAVEQDPPAPERETDPKPAPPTAAFPGEGYELAQVRRGEKVQVLDEPGGKVVARIGDESELFASPRVFSVVEPRPRWLGVIAAELGNEKMGWIRYDPQKLLLGDTRVSLRVDLSDRRLTLLRDDEVMDRAVVTIGRAGNETPTGRYSVTDTITEGLNPVYGAGAVVLSARQYKVPVTWAGGNMIAVHGWNGPVGEAASSGCLRVANEDVLELIARAPLGAPVFISA
jgi:L,D-transpeptidase catalytic domain